MNLEISPEPTAAERAAILEALAAEAAEEATGASAWAAEALPQRDAAPDHDP